MYPGDCALNQNFALCESEAPTQATFTGSDSSFVPSPDSPVALDRNGVTFKWKNYRAKGRERAKLMTLATDEFIRRFLIHVLPKGFHRIRHYGLFAKASGVDNIARARELLTVPKLESESASADASDGDKPLVHPCPCYGGRMIVIETFKRGATPRHRPTGPIVAIRIDTS